MRATELLILGMIALGAGGCGDRSRGDRQPGRKADRKVEQRQAVRGIAETDCARVTATARRCRAAIEALAGKAPAARPVMGALARPGVSRASRLIAEVAEQTWCPGHVRAVARYQRTDCSKHIGSQIRGAVKICEQVKRRQERSVRLLQRCFGHTDCAKVARCFVQEYEPLRSRRARP